MSANENTTDTGSTTVSYSSAAGGAENSDPTPTTPAVANSSQSSNSEQTSAPVSVGSRTGQVRMFNRFRGYGFITVHGEDNLDVFVHQTNVCPTLSTFRYLSVGEYVSLDISEDDKRQALNVRGINGGPLQCDAPRRRRPRQTNGESSPNGEDDQGEYQVVDRSNRRQGGDRRHGGGRGRGDRRQGGRGRGDSRSRAEGVSAGRSGQGVNLAEFMPSVPENTGSDAPVATSE